MLNERECKIIKYRFGFEEDPKTLKEIAEIFDRSSHRISQITLKALRKLRKPSNLKRLLPNYTLRIQDLQKVRQMVAYQEELDEIEDEKPNKINTAPINYSAIHIEELELTVRAYNGLKRGGIDNIGALANMSIEDLSRIRNLGNKTLEEIISKVKNKFGIIIKNESEMISPSIKSLDLLPSYIKYSLRYMGVYRINQLSAQPTSKLHKHFDKADVRKIAEALEKQYEIKLEDDANILVPDIDFDGYEVEFTEYTSDTFKCDYENNVSIGVLNLPIHIERALCNAGINTIYKLVKIAIDLTLYVDLTDADLITIRQLIIERYGGPIIIQ